MTYLTPFRRGDHVECIKRCSNNFDQRAEFGDRFTVSDCIPHPVWDDMALVYFRGHNQKWGFISTNFRKVEDEAEAA